LKVIKARSQYEPLARFPTWLFRIARHRLIDHYRQHAGICWRITSRLPTRIPRRATS
jgi:DNA-directed RNA polymerase specialized sigma24 family protein